MAIAVDAFVPVANWFTTTSPKTITGLSWDIGDEIVVVGGSENAGTTLNTPTNANLTFTLQTSQATGGANEATVYIWTAIAGSSQTGQTISIAATGAGERWGFALWINSGGSGSFANIDSNRTESGFVFTPSAGSLVVYVLMDWNANTTNQVLTTATGTVTERVDDGDGSSYGMVLGDWINVTAVSSTFGVTSYTGLKVSHGVIELLAAAGDQDLAIPFTQFTTTFHAPTVENQTALNLAVGFFASVEQLFAPDFVKDLEIPFHQQVTGFFPLTIENQASSNLEVVLLAPATQLFTPTLTSTPLELNIGFISSTLQLFAVTLTHGDQNLDISFFDNAEQLFAPTLQNQAPLDITPVFLESTVQIFAPSLISQALDLSIPFHQNTTEFFVIILTNEGEDLFEPILAGNGTLADQIMNGLISQGFLAGSLADRERARLLAKLALIEPQNLSIQDLYELAVEDNRLAGLEEPVFA